MPCLRRGEEGLFQSVLVYFLPLPNREGKAPLEINPWQNQKKCGSAKQRTAVISMTRTEGTGRARCPRGPVSKTCLRTGNARYAARAKRCSGPLQGQALWRLRPIRAERRDSDRNSQTMPVGLDMPGPVDKLRIIPINFRPGFFEL